ncbi:hypothetical protein [Microvirga brassicacearum]|uniref:Uncharacterized protein n=1 Tax=Microvirga brassicacearum TaxID=2580413 RepID=A0A5N3PH55_9HYPH|nr:hypothetical protein [Microvirga brassicacearum]KAB0269033.1 hypothetical protein FEZ63_02690 [Microvirga brassicacearum]
MTSMTERKLKFAIDALEKIDDMLTPMSENKRRIAGDALYLIANMDESAAAPVGSEAIAAGDFEMGPLMPVEEFAQMGVDAVNSLLKERDELLAERATLIEERDEARKGWSELGHETAEWASRLAEITGRDPRLPDRMGDFWGKFQVGDKVWKHTGDYQLAGEVRGIAHTIRGHKRRYVVEHEAGFLHIYSEANLCRVCPSCGAPETPASDANGLHPDCPLPRR